jgi:hypothetical protein
MISLIGRSCWGLRPNAGRGVDNLLLNIHIPTPINMMDECYNFILLEACIERSELRSSDSKNPEGSHDYSNEDKKKELCPEALGFEPPRRYCHDGLFLACPAGGSPQPGCRAFKNADSGDALYQINRETASNSGGL